MADLRGGLIGCGWFAKNHLHAWAEVRGAEIAAVCDLDAAKARAYAEEFGIRGVYTDAKEMFRREALDFADVVTSPGTHREVVELAAGHGLHVVCQKPLAPSMEDARAMVEACRAAGVRFMVHENFRWQTPMRAVKEAAAEVGPLFFGRVSWRTAFDVFANQPYLGEDARFVIADMGVHLLDLARFFMGEVERLSCQTERVNPRIKGEDVATIMLRMRGGGTCLVELSYASRLEEDPFPQTLVALEGARGSATLGPDFALVLVNEKGTSRLPAAPGPLSWGIPLIHHIQESVLKVQQHWTDCLREGRDPETSGEDNLKTLELVYGAYEAAETGQPYRVSA
jgi:predicted dehydrogenase